VCNNNTAQWKTDFGITITPAFFFFHKGIKVDQLLDLNETLPDFNILKQPDNNSPDEITLKKKITDLCALHSIKTN
jgi:hypothetical protein